MLGEMLDEPRIDTHEFTIQVRQRGQLTIPQKLREALSIEAGDTLTILQIGDAFLATPQRLRSFELADKMASMMEEAGLTLADLLEDLPKIREEIYNERYGTQNS